MTKRQIIELAAAILAVVAVILVLSGCVLEHASDGSTWLYPVGGSAHGCYHDADCGLPVADPASKPGQPDPNEYQ